MPRSRNLRRLTVQFSFGLIVTTALVLVGLDVDGAVAAETPPSCTAGQYLSDGACVDAPVGGYVADSGATTFELCPVGFFQDQPGRTSCKPIPAGSEGTGGTEGKGSTGVRLCVAGSFRGESESTGICAPAPIGGFVADSGATTFQLCPVGRFQDQPGQASCKPIPLGSEGSGGATDVDGKGSTGVRTCAVGSFRSEAETTPCKPIPEGSGGTGGDSEGKGSTGVRLCAAGTFRPAGASTACTPAPPGSFVPVDGSRAAALCPAGRYAPTSGATECTAAAVGFYVPRPGSREQLRCATATTTGLSVCPPPTSGTGTTPTTPTTPPAPDVAPQGDECPPGTWSMTGTSRAGSSCIPARPGTYVDTAGSTAEIPCPPGSFSDAFGAESCTLAPIGTFVSAEGAMDPTPCPGATEAGLDRCPELAAIATPAGVEEQSASTSVWRWVGVLLLVLVGAGGGLLALQRRTGLLSDADIPPAPAGTSGAVPSVPSARATPPESPTPTQAPDVLEWDEALDGPKKEPPASPTR